jgi:hypothetical protein
MRQIADRLHRVTNYADPGKLSGRIITTEWDRSEITEPDMKWVDSLDFVDRAVNSDFLYLQPCLVWINSTIHYRYALLAAGKVAKLEECR